MYDYYIALDWAQAKMAIAIEKNNSSKPKIYEKESDIRSLKYLLKSLKGNKILTLEESTASHWLWVELHEYVDEIIICDPYHNFLLSSGPKNDKIDAEKLLVLLKADLLKPVYHSNSVFVEYRKLMSSYEDIIKSGVRWKNRRSAILRAQGKSKLCRSVDGEADKLVFATTEYYIMQNNEMKKFYHDAFKKLTNESKILRALQSIPGIGLVGALKIAGTVIDPARFPTKGHFWAYCGLVKHHKMSGGRSYGSRKTRYSSSLKSVFKSAVLAVTGERCQNSFKDYYLHLLANDVPRHDASHKVARKIATVALSIMESGKYYRAERMKKCKEDSGN